MSKHIASRELNGWEYYNALVALRESCGLSVAAVAPPNALDNPALRRVVGDALIDRFSALHDDVHSAVMAIARAVSDAIADEQMRCLDRAYLAADMAHPGVPSDPDDIAEAINGD